MLEVTAVEKYIKRITYGYSKTKIKKSLVCLFMFYYIYLTPTVVPFVRVLKAVATVS